jgi:cellulose synthase/poly-beta-1,6-N-acetylglucosamine synthase-like glycosyltransferase
VNGTIEGRSPSLNAAGSVAVVIPTFNRSRVVRRAIESVLAQTRPADEIIVVDDGSTDGTAAVVSSYPGVRLIRKTNGGLASARNAGILANQCEWVAFLDDDDWFAPNLLEKLEDAVSADPGVELIYAATYRVDREGRNVGRNLRGHRLPAVPLAALAIENFILCSAVRVRRRTLLEAGLFDPSVRLCEDQDLWLRVAALGARFAYISQPLAYITKQSTTMSGCPLRMALATLNVLERRETCLRQLAPSDGRAWWLAGAHYRLGRVHWEAGDFATAASEFQQANAYDPSHRGARLYGWASRHPHLVGLFGVGRLIKRRATRILQHAGWVEARWG